MDSRVFVVHCGDYNQAGEALGELLAMMGGIGRFVREGERVVLKPNLLRAARPEDAVTTHPSVVAAVGRMIDERGATAVLADSPGAGYSYDERTLARTYRECGMDRAAQEGGIELSYDTGHEEMSFPEGRLIKRFEIITPVAQADGVINLCKLKTHMFTGMTGAVKNLFGVVPGLIKPGYHAKLADTRRFVGMMLDLAALVAPRLNIMDAVVSMEGDGPSSGEPRRVGLLLASESPLALDVVAAEIMGLPREENPLLVEAEARGMAPGRADQVEVVGAELDDLRLPDFALPSARGSGVGLVNMRWWHRLVLPLMKSAMSARPLVAPNRCIGCGACARACPVGVIEIVAGRNGSHARIDDSGCIRCYCCHEMCPEDAIDLRTGLLFRLVNR